ncbi:matrix metalloproteinase-16-like [Onthophagus taurus]|uniref:matrix metalloproteinase-16-like n=1 Tax=Onthophagus taurus TaxID=166361 RepID=UPI0039BE7F12
MKRILTFCFLTCLLLVGVICRSVQPNTKHQIRLNALEFMKKFGYLQPDTESSAALYTDESLSNALKEVQKFGAIPQTGKLDEETIKLMSKPRCGLPDKDSHQRAKRFTLGPTSWKKRNITFFVANAPYSLGEEKVAQDIQTALDLWGRYSNLNFKRHGSPDADIIVSFASGYHSDYLPFDGPGGVLAHAYFPQTYGSLSGDVHFDADENWTQDDTDDGHHFLAVAVHELGHSLGLSHSPDENSVMFSYYKSRGNSIALGYDDVLAMYELYIKRDPFENDREVEKHESKDRYNSYDEKEKSDEETTTSTTTSKPTTTSNESAEKKEYRITTETYYTFEGDTESVETHKNHDQFHGIPPKMPDICQGNFDAVATLRNELFVFKDKFLWRLIDKSELFPGYPIPIRQMFPLPEEINKVDAAYERPDGNIVIFAGKSYWIFNGGTFIEGSPLPLTTYGLPDYLDKIDAVQTWSKNSKTYLYRGDRFWRYNETSKTIDEGYPKHMEAWPGVPQDLDAANTWKDNVTYFFKGKSYWRFDNNWVKTTDLSPLPAPQIWLGCPKEEDLLA